MNNLNERDYQAYRAVFELVVANLPRPDLLIYLTAPVPVLMERIRQRGRPIEAAITADYLSLLDSFYQEWLAVFDLSPVLTLRTQQLDFVHHARHLDSVIDHIEATLAGREELILE